MKFSVHVNCYHGLVTQSSSNATVYILYFQSVDDVTCIPEPSHRRTV